MKSKHAAFALVDLFVIAAIAVVLLSFAVPTLSRARELSKRSVCGVNLTGIGATGKIYAHSNNDQWMVPPFKRGAIDNGGIDYVNDSLPSVDSGDVGDDRQHRTMSETPLFPNFGSEAMSVTRAYWMLVRSGDVTVKQFICPSSFDSPDPTGVIDFYYDFTGYANISYGYLVPFGPQETQPREGADHRKVFAADKGPFYAPSNPPWKTSGEDGRPIDLDDPPKNWRRYNSRNHGGNANGDGQNVLYGDGHASFVRVPVSGIDNDNIYTLMRDDWSTVYGRIHGDTPQEAPDPPYPGQNALGSNANAYSSTDSLIYP